LQSPSTNLFVNVGVPLLSTPPPPISAVLPDTMLFVSVNVAVLVFQIPPPAKGWRGKARELHVLECSDCRGRHHAVERHPPNPPPSQSRFRPDRAHACLGAPEARRRLGFAVGRSEGQTNPADATGAARKRRGKCPLARSLARRGNSCPKVAIEYISRFVILAALVLLRPARLPPGFVVD